MSFLSTEGKEIAMIRRLTLSSALLTSLLLATTLAPKAAAGTWGFEGTTYPGGDVVCSGEPNSPHLPSSCDLTSSSGYRVVTSQFGQLCAASIYCGQFVHTCLASETRGSRSPVFCWAVGYATGTARAECKSDYGNWYLICPNDLQSDQEEMSLPEVIEGLAKGEEATRTEAAASDETTSDAEAPEKD